MTASAERFWYRVEFDLGHGWKIVSHQLHATEQDVCKRALTWLLSEFPHYKGYGFLGTRAIKTGM